MNIKQVFKRTASFLLASMFMISSGITSLAASGIGSNGTGGGFESNPATLRSISDIHTFHVNSGFKVSIVDKNGVSVSNDAYFVKAYPWDINALAKVSTEEYLKGWNTYYNTTGIWNEPKDEIVYVGLGKKDPFYIESKGQINKDGSQPTDNSGLKTIKYDIVDGAAVTEGIEEGDTVYTVNAKMYTITDLSLMLNTQIMALGGDVRIGNTFTEKEYTLGGQKYQYIDMIPASVELRTTGQTGLYGTGEWMKALMMRPIKNVYDENNKEDTKIRILHALLSVQMPNRDGKGTLVGEGERVFQFYDQTMTNKLNEYYNKYLAENYKDALAYASAMIDTMSYYGCKIQFESVGWAVPTVLIPGLPMIKDNPWGYTWSTHEIVFGTISGIVAYTNRSFCEDPSAEEFFKAHGAWGTTNWTGWLRSHNAIFNFEWNMLPSVYRTEKDEFNGTLKAYTPDMFGGSDYASLIENFNTAGYGVMYFNPDLQPTGTPTWDSDTYPPSNYEPGPAPDTSNPDEYPKETTYNENNNKANIIKFYVKKQGSEEVPVSNFTRENTIHNIEINDEPGYRVVDYFSSKEFKKPTSQSDRYEDTKNSIPNGTVKGTSSGSVVLTPESGENNLYIKLLADVKVVKIYTTGGNTDKVETDPNPEFSDGKLIIKTPDDGYDYEENTQSPEDKDVTSWEEVPDGKTTTDTTVPIEDDTTVIYIHYNKDPEDTGSKLLLHENEISHQFNLSDANGGSLVDGIRKYSSVSSSDTCTVDTDPDPDDYDSCDTDYTYDYSDDWSFTITNDSDYASNKTFTWAWVQTDQKDYSGNGLSESGGTGTSTPNGEIILQRTINDTVTLYPGKNGGNESKLQEMGLRAPSYTPAKARKDGATDQPTRKTWYETFTTNWQFHNANTPTAYFSPSCGHGGTDTDSHTNTGNEATVNETYSKANNTEIYGLWGRANAGLSEPNETSNLSSAKWVFNNLNFIPRKEHLKTSEIQFYPYYKMKFVSEINGAEQDAYLTSENLSKLLNVQRVDTSISANGNTSTGNSLYLDSTQWSIHTKAQTLLANNGVQDSRSLLPSGAIYTLSDGELSGNKAPNKYIGIHLYSTYVADKSKLANTGDILNESEANAQIDAFKEEVKRVLEGYEIQMFGALGIIADEDEFQKEAVKITGTAGDDGKYQIGTSIFDRDTSKYDLETNENYTSHTAEANRADIDIKHIDEVTYDWKLTSDADGNIRIYRDGQELASLTKTQGVASITNPDVQEFDARTKLVTNYVAALDRNMGSDRTGNKWYNEGWDELHCKELRISYTMGFARDNNGSAGQRSAALNIKANGVLDSRTDMFNGAEEKNRTWRFLTSEKSLAAQDKNVGYIGRFNGIEVFVPGMQSLFTSKLFYTSNTSVMDLN